MEDVIDDNGPAASRHADTLTNRAIGVKTSTHEH
jgi:hypothetical protein